MDQESTSRLFVDTVSTLFECLGRALICLDPDFRVMHASDDLDSLAAPGAARVRRRALLAPLTEV